MTVYVDDANIPADVSIFMNRRWFHLIADTQQELHAFAGRLGLRRAWFQDPLVNTKRIAAPGSRAAENWHYDITEGKKWQAIRLGAVQVTWRELSEIIDARYDASQRETTHQESTEQEATTP
jgi:hypothetical protein